MAFFSANNDPRDFAAASLCVCISFLLLPVPLLKNSSNRSSAVRETAFLADNMTSCTKQGFSSKVLNSVTHFEGFGLHAPQQLGDTNFLRHFSTLHCKGLFNPLCPRGVLSILVVFRVYALWSDFFIPCSMMRGIQRLGCEEDTIGYLLLIDYSDLTVEVQDRSLYFGTYDSMFCEKPAHPPPIPIVLCSRLKFFSSNPLRTGYYTLYSSWIPSSRSHCSFLQCRVWSQRF
jgi:hypothetical protein